MRHRTATLLRVAVVAGAATVILATTETLKAQSPAVAVTSPAPTGAPLVMDIQLKAAERLKYLGMFNTTLAGQPAGTFRVYEQEGTLFGEVNGRHSSVMLYQGNNVFRLKEDPTYTVTFAVEKGVAKSLVAQGERERLDGTRAPVGP